VEKKIELGVYSLSARAGVLLRLFNAASRRKVFDDGNGEKILKRILRLCREWGAFIGDGEVFRIIRMRPAVRNAVLRYRSHFDFTIPFARELIHYVDSGSVVDDATLVDIAKCLVDMRVTHSAVNQAAIKGVSAVLSDKGYFGAYSCLWVLSKYGEPHDIYRHVRDRCLAWKNDWAMARLIGGTCPRLWGTVYHNHTFSLLAKNSIDEALGLFEFHRVLRTDAKQNKNVIDVVAAPNLSSPCKISHSKFLVLLSLSRNSAIPAGVISKLKKRHSFKVLDGFYAKSLPAGW
jgi:hypothetical protein